MSLSLSVRPIGAPAQSSDCEGTVRFPGEYPLIDGMSVGDLIELAGGLLDSAYSQSAEIARIDMSNPNRAVSRLYCLRSLIDLCSAWSRLIM